MQAIPKLPILEFTDDALESIRKCHNLHDPGRMEEAVDILCEWIQKQEHFLRKDFPRDYLERIIISTKGSLEKAKVRLDKICTMKTLAPKYFQDQDLRDVKHVLDGFKFFVLPKFAPDYYRVYFVKGYAKHITANDFQAFYKYSIRFCEYWMKHDYFNGFILVLDFTHKDLNILEFITNNNPSELHQHIVAYMKVYGARLKGIHIVTSSKLADALVSFIKPFFGAKLATRFHVYKKMDDLFETVPRDIFPIEYGGKEKSIAELHDKWFEVLNSKEHREYIKETVKAGTNESRRLINKLNDEYLGMPGTFRVLKID
ncbi:alpha-tocopherol transfer protein-like [Manduca sexta]